MQKVRNCIPQHVLEFHADVIDVQKEAAAVLGEGGGALIPKPYILNPKHPQPEDLKPWTRVKPKPMKPLNPQDSQR